MNQVIQLTLDTEVLYASVSTVNADLCAVPVELRPFASILFFLENVSLKRRCGVTRGKPYLQLLYVLIAF